MLWGFPLGLWMITTTLVSGSGEDQGSSAPDHDFPVSIRISGPLSSGGVHVESDLSMGMIYRCIYPLISIRISRLGA